MKKNVLVTGNLGFIGTVLVKELLARDEIKSICGIDRADENSQPQYLASHLKFLERVPCDFVQIVRDVCSLAGIAENLDKDVGKEFAAGDLPDMVFHLAAQSHVDTCQKSPLQAVQDNVMGTLAVLQFVEAVQKHKPCILIHVSTDEVFGELNADDTPWSRRSTYAPRSVYASTKAASDLLCMAYATSKGVDVRITHCTNNYGVGQHPEKLIPKVIQRIRNKQPITINNDGKQIRDWIDVNDHVRGLIAVALKGEKGKHYCFGGNNQISVLEVIQCILHESKQDSEVVFDQFARPHDDRRYAINCQETRQELDWYPNRSSCFASVGIREILNTPEPNLTREDALAILVNRNWDADHGPGTAKITDEPNSDSECGAV